jgi:hypothetical protein
MAGSSAIWTGNDIYIFGGRTIASNKSIDLDSIYKYNPESNTCIKMKAILPFARYSTAAVWNNGKTYIAGGSCSNGYTDEVLVYDHNNDKVSVYDQKLSVPMASWSFALVENKLMFFGGDKTGNPPSLVEIVLLPELPKDTGSSWQAIAMAVSVILVSIIFVVLFLFRIRKK